MFRQESAWGNQDRTTDRKPSVDALLKIEDWQELEGFNAVFGQKVVYQTLVDHFGEDRAIAILSEIIPVEVARLQVNALTTEKPSDV